MKNLLLVMVAILPGGLMAQNEVFTRSGAAVNGYDVVAYFTEGQPVMGSSDHQFMWKEATWLFATDENLQAFKSDPEKYAPQYGGYCAYGMFEGHKAPTQPDAWTIVEGKLYLNYNTNVRGLWREDIPGHIKKADENWPAIRTKP